MKIDNVVVAADLEIREAKADAADLKLAMTGADDLNAAIGALLPLVHDDASRLIVKALAAQGERCVIAWNRHLLQLAREQS